MRKKGNFDVENKRKVRRLGQLDPNAAASSTFRACQLFSGVYTIHDVQVELVTSENIYKKFSSVQLCSFQIAGEEKLNV